MLRADAFVLSHATNAQCFCSYTIFAVSIISIYDAQAACFIFYFYKLPGTRIVLLNLLMKYYVAKNHLNQALKSLVCYTACMIPVACCTHSLNKVKQNGAAT
jgi:hypothetical protein